MNIFDTMQSLLEIGDIHAGRLSVALSSISHLLPFQPSQLKSFTANELGHLEMVTSRFAKLQDILGSKIFPLLLELLQEGRSEDSALDRLHKLEKLGILPSAHEWIMMSELRNHITHEYPDNPALTASNLNKTVAYAQDLIAFWTKLKVKIATEKHKQL